MHPKLALALMSALAVAACSDPVASASSADPTLAVTSNDFDKNIGATVTNDFDKNIVGTVTNDCTGEEGTGIARVHIVTTGSNDEAGGAHGTFHLNVDGKVTFGTETRYLFHQTTEFLFNGKLGEEQTINSVFTLNGQGSAPDEVIQFVLHYTITPGGAVPTDWEWGNLKCG
jgi:hypothetical protein